MSTATLTPDVPVRRKRKLLNKNCSNCGADFSTRRKATRYCSPKCAAVNNGGQNAKPECWWVSGNGYVEGKIRVGDKQIRVKRHRLIAESIIGRPLRRDEDVHHIDGNRQNNAPENLRVMPHGEHSSMHGKMRHHKSGYKLKLTAEQRMERSIMAIRRGLGRYPRPSKRQGVTASYLIRKTMRENLK